MGKYLLLFFGSFLGALLRYLLSGWVYKYFPPTFPYGTIFVNLIGCLVIGFFWGVFDNRILSVNFRIFLFIGFIGSFTTFSSFALENFNLIRDNEWGLALINILISNIGGIILVFVGYWISKVLGKF